MLNLFGLILVWKRVGEQALEASGLDWTVIRPEGCRSGKKGWSKRCALDRG